MNTLPPFEPILLESLVYIPALSAVPFCFWWWGYRGDAQVWDGVGGICKRWLQLVGLVLVWWDAMVWCTGGVLWWRGWPVFVPHPVQFFLLCLQKLETAAKSIGTAKNRLWDKFSLFLKIRSLMPCNYNRSSAIWLVISNLKVAQPHVTRNVAQNTRPSSCMRKGLSTRLRSSHIPTPGNKAIKSRTDVVSEPDPSQGLVPRLELDHKTVSLNYQGSY